MQRDPLGYVDGMNLMEYVGSNVVNWIDPIGTEGRKVNYTVKIDISAKIKTTDEGHINLSSEVTTKIIDLSPEQIEWAKKIFHDFKKYQNKIKGGCSKLDACTLVAQWALETGYGISKLARDHNNLGGIKHRSGYEKFGTKVKHVSHEENRTRVEISEFMSYQNLEKFYGNYVHKICVESIYKEVYNEDKSIKKGKEYYDAIQKAPYCLDTNYSEEIMKIYKKIKAFGICK